MEKHIKQILLEVNTIIIPGLGAITVTNHNTGEVMFMPYLKYDDGKLASFVAEKEEITLEDAKALISEDVSTILNAIEVGNGFNLDGIGSFKKDSSGDIEFKSGVYVESSSTLNVSEDLKVIKELVIEETSVKVEEQIIERVSSEVEDEIAIESDEDVVSEETPVENENKKKGFFSMLNKEAVNPIESVQLEEEESDIAFEIELPKEELVEKEVFQDIEKEENSSPVEERVEEVSVPENTVEVEELIDIQGDNSDEVVSTESISENTITDEEFLTEEEVIAPFKKKRGVKFWIFTILILAILGGGTFLGLNFDKYKKYLPFGSKTETIDISEEKKIIEKLESDDTEPINEKATKTEEMIHSSPVEEKLVEKVIPDPKEEEPIVQADPVHKSHSKAKSDSKVKMEDVQVQSIIDGSSYIILGTYAEKVNAIGQVEMLLSKGKKGVSVIERDSKFSVSYGTYSSKEEAIAKLEEAKSAYSHAWVLHK